MSKITFKTMGQHFGYPKCCVQWFEDRVEGKVPFALTTTQEKILDYNGFVPCPSCAEKVFEEETTLEALITDRKHPTPYPESDHELMAQLILAEDEDRDED